MKSAASSAQPTEIKSDFEIDVPLLLKSPLQALVPLLQKVRGWEEVRLAKRVCMHEVARPVPNLRITLSRKFRSLSDRLLD